MTPLIVVVVVLAVAVWQRTRIAQAWRRSWAVFVPVPTVAADDGLDVDDPFALVRRIAARLTLAESFNRTLKRLVFALAAVVAVVAILATAFFVDSRHKDDQRERDRLERTSGSCQQDNVTRSQINAGDDAKVAILDALRSVQHDEIDSLLAPLVDRSDPRSAAFIARYEEGRADVEAALARADQLTEAARVAIRDCSPEGIDAYLNRSPGG